MRHPTHRAPVRGSSLPGAMTGRVVAQRVGSRKGWLHSMPSKLVIAAVTLVALVSVGGLAVVVAPLALGPLFLFASGAPRVAASAGWWLLGVALAAEGAWILSFAVDDAGASPLRWLLPIAAAAIFTAAVVVARRRRAAPA